MNLNDLKKQIVEAGAKIYEAHIPSDIDRDGFMLANFDDFIDFISINNIKICFLNLIYSDAEEYLITDEMIEDNVEEGSVLFKKIQKKVKEYNDKVKKIDFSIPAQIYVVILYEGQIFYYSSLEDFVIDSDALLEPEDALENILFLFENELDEENKKHKEMIEVQKEKLINLIKNDDRFKLCTNKHLRRDYVIDLFKNRLGKEYKELKLYWTNDQVPAYVYRGAIDLVELIWNEMKLKK